MHIHIVPNRGSPPTVLLRESYREGSKVRKRTLANLSSLSAVQVEAIRATLAGQAVLSPQSLEITASRPHGHVHAVTLAMQRLDFASLLGGKPSRERELVRAMVAARIVAPHTKLATTRWWHTSTLAEDFGVADANENDLYAAMDWLLARQDAIQNKLAARHLSEGELQRLGLLGGLRQRHVDQGGRTPGLVLGRTELHQQLVARELLALQRLEPRDVATKPLAPHAALLVDACVALRAPPLNLAAVRRRGGCRGRGVVMEQTSTRADPFANSGVVLRRYA